MIVGTYKGEKLKIEYLENENYKYTVGNIEKRFRTNSMVKALAKVLFDLGIENLSLNKEGYLYAFQISEECPTMYEIRTMAHAIGLSCHYSLDHLENSKGEKLKRYRYCRNYYSIQAERDNPNLNYEWEKLIKMGYMERVYKGCFKVTWQGIYYLELLYDLQISMDHNCVD